MKIIKPSVEIMDEINGIAILKKIERCGRVCYKSEDKITGDSCVRFVKHLIARGHESVLEHVSITVKFICDRGVSHEIVRHRIASYSQESTRYCNYGGDGIAVIEPFYLDENDNSYYSWKLSCMAAETRYNILLARGCSPQEARAVLPNSLKTELIMTANLREWRHFLKLRCDKSAHPQMREVANMLLERFKNAIPVIFDDIEVVVAVQDRGSGSRSVQD